VLLPDWMLARRAYAAPVIWDVLVAHASGQGYRVIALRRGLPESTVRDWLRNFRAVAADLNRAAVIALEQRASAMPAWRLHRRPASGQHEPTPPRRPRDLKSVAATPQSGLSPGETAGDDRKGRRQ
jgi:hypothetical protein